MFGRPYAAIEGLAYGPKTLVEQLKGRRLPPLNALRVFEVVGRHLSMSSAASELHMTQGAVSQQVRRLESYLRVALFHRGRRGMTFTPAGQRLFASASPALASIATATESARRIASSNTVIVNTLASLASWWLLPRLAALEASMPNIAPRVEVSRRTVRFENEDVDLAIRYGAGRWAGVVAQRLFELRVASVIAKGYGPSRGQSADEWVASGEMRLLCDARHDYWTVWAARQRVERSRIENRLLMVDDMNVLLNAARAGQGVAVVPLFLILDELRAGRLELLDREILRLPGGYWLVHPPEEARRPVRDVMDWLGEQAAHTERDLTSLLSSLGIK